MFVSSECVAVMSGAVVSAAAMSVLSFSLEAAMGVLSPSSSCSVFVSSDCVAVMSGAVESAAAMGVSSEFASGASQ